jgi:hypothetical protein
VANNTADIFKTGLPPSGDFISYDQTPFEPFELEAWHKAGLSFWVDPVTRLTYLRRSELDPFLAKHLFRLAKNNHRRSKRSRKS